MKTQMRIQLIASVFILVASQLVFASSGEIPSCQQQRDRYPVEWGNTKSDHRLFFCWSEADHNGSTTAFTLKLSEANKQGQKIMSLVVQDLIGQDRTKKTFRDTNEEENVYRISLTVDQARRLEQGENFSAILRSVESCFDDGIMKEGVVFRRESQTNTAEGLPLGTTYQGQSISCRESHSEQNDIQLRN